MRSNCMRGCGGHKRNTTLFTKTGSFLILGIFGSAKEGQICSVWPKEQAAIQKKLPLVTGQAAVYKAIAD